MKQWAGIMRERVESGMSIVKYCEREGMPTSRYHYWQRRLRAAVAKELVPVEVESTVPTGWTEAVSEERHSQSNTEVTIEIGKCRLGVNGTSDMNLVTKVCKALMSLC